MIIFPAIDIKDGKVVRLLQGQFDEVTEYGTDPLAMAHHWVDLGAQWLHIIDLDGAEGKGKSNAELIGKIAKTVNVPVQTGGGIRDEETVERLADGGLQRIILGTRAIEDPDFLAWAIVRFSRHIAVSLDCSHGKVATRGWTSVTQKPVVDVARDFKTLGLECLIYTDIGRDGMLSGPDIEGLRRLLDVVAIPLIASGGLSGPEDIEKLCQLESSGLIGAITGKAIYEGTLDFQWAVQRCSQNV